MTMNRTYIIIFLDHIQELLLSEIRKMLDGSDADQQSIAHAAHIIEATKAVPEF
jgi:hypothetical protein